MLKSKNHICFNGKFEYYQKGSEVYRANINNSFDAHSEYRIGRWECSIIAFNRFKDVILGNS